MNGALRMPHPQRHPSSFRLLPILVPLLLLLLSLTIAAHGQGNAGDRDNSAAVGREGGGGQKRTIGHRPAPTTAGKRSEEETPRSSRLIEPKAEENSLLAKIAARQALGEEEEEEVGNHKQEVAAAATASKDAPRSTIDGAAASPRQHLSSSSSLPDCLALVGPTTHTLGGVDQVDLSNITAAALTMPADGIVRDTTQQRDLSCRFFYYSATAQPQPHNRESDHGRGAATKIPSDTKRLVDVEEEEEDCNRENGGGAGRPVIFPSRYKVMDKQRQQQTGYFDVLLGLPEVRHASPLRPHRPLFFHQVAKAEEEKEANVETPADYASAGSNRKNFPHLHRLYSAVVGHVGMFGHRAWRALLRYPYHSPAALHRLFTVRTLRVSFPLWERHRRLRSDFAATSGFDGSEAAGRSRGANAEREDDDEEKEEEDVWDSELLPSSTLSSPPPVSRAALLSEGSLHRLRVVSFPPTPRRYRRRRVESGQRGRSGKEPAKGREEEEEEERFICDFKFVLRAAAHVRDVEQEVKRLAEARASPQQQQEGLPHHRNGGGFDIEEEEDGTIYGGSSDNNHNNNKGEEEAAWMMRKGSAKQPSWLLRFLSSTPSASATATDEKSSRSSRRTHRPAARGEGVLSYFPLYAWLYRTLMGLMFASLASSPSPSNAPGGHQPQDLLLSSSSSVHHPPPSYYLARDYLALVREELGPLQPLSLSFSSDYARYVLGRRPLYTSQRLLHVESTEEEEPSSLPARKGKHHHQQHQQRRRRAMVKESEVFVWQASMPATETMCLGLIALAPTAVATASTNGHALPLHIHEELSFDFFWLKMFLPLLVFHVYIKKHFENSRVFAFIFASLCGFFALFVLFLFYIVKKIQGMSVGKMGLYMVFFFGGATALLEGLLSLATLVVQQLMDAVDAQDSGGGVGFLSLLFSSSSDGGGGEGGGAFGLGEGQRHALLLVAVVVLVLLTLGAVSSLVVRCFVSEAYLRAGTWLSLRVCLAAAWLLVFAVNREATALSLLVYLVLRHPRRLASAASWLLFVRRPRGNGTTIGFSPEHGRRTYGETAYEPTDDIPDSARAFVERVTPLTCEGSGFLLPSTSSAGGGQGGEDGHNTQKTHAQRMRKYEADGAAHTRRALEELAKVIRAEPGKYASRLRDPNGVQRWAGEAITSSEEEGDEEA